MIKRLLVGSLFASLVLLGVPSVGFAKPEQHTKSSRKRSSRTRALRAQKKALRALRQARRVRRTRGKGRAARREAKTFIRAFLAKQGLRRSSIHYAHPKAHKLPTRIGAFPIPSGMAPRVRFWSLIFGRHASDEVAIYNPRYHIIITTIKVAGAALSPYDSNTVRRAKSRHRIKVVANSMHKVRSALRSLARREARAESAAWRQLRSWRKHCKALSSRLRRYTCRKMLTSAYFDRRSWKSHFRDLKNPLARKIWRRIQREPYFRTHHKWYRTFRLLRSQRLSWQSSYRAFFKKGFLTERRYRPHIQEILRKAKLPPLLSALPFVESMYNPSVRSFVGAIGLWQIMPDTGKETSLYIARRRHKKLTPYDERLDPMMATKAATRFLHLCRHYFRNSWPLAITSYNQGPGRMLRLARRAGRRSLPRIIRVSSKRSFGPDGRNFYSKFLASAFLMKHQRRFFPRVSNPAIRFRKLVLKQPIWMTELARRSGLPSRTILLYNPSLHSRKWNPLHPIPAYFPIRVPKAKYAKVRRALRPFLRNRTSIRVYRSKQGESLWRIAKRFQVPLKSLSIRKIKTLSDIPSFPKPHLLAAKRRHSKLCAHKRNKQFRLLRWKKSPKKCKRVSPYKRLKPATPVLIPAPRYAASSGALQTIRIKGNTPLAYIACRSCTTIWHLRHLNPHLSIRRLRPGTELRVPRCSYARRRLFRRCYLFHFRRMRARARYRDRRRLARRKRRRVRRKRRRVRRKRRRYVKRRRSRRKARRKGRRRKRYVKRRKRTRKASRRVAFNRKQK